ncbi:MAG: hypothetical protein CL931_15640 [Deltaproteobacteria bacterium]|nr:hypothetical protein [Deltaproteobacteria bacterium]
MWVQRDGIEEQRRAGRADPSRFEGSRRRAYYRVAGILPIRLTPLAPGEVEAAVFDLSMPDPLCQPVGEGEEDTPLMARLRRIEEKLDLLLGVSPVDVPRQLSGRDRRSLVFSGSGLSIDVPWSYSQGDAYRVEILLPPPYARTLRAVAFAVRDPLPEVGPDGNRALPLALEHMDDDDRDALVAYSYDLQRFALRARNDVHGVSE